MGTYAVNLESCTEVFCMDWCSPDYQILSSSQDSRLCDSDMLLDLDA